VKRISGQEREDLLVSLLEQIDQETCPKRLGKLQSEIESIRPRGADTQAVLEACSAARKAAKKF
jgi:hypothetical protein